MTVAVPYDSKTPAARQRGVTYLAVIFAVAVLGLLSAATGQVWQTAAKREKEAELLFIGNQFRQAIGAYYERSPGATKEYPEKLEDLLADNRFPMPQRHLRRLYRDPMTGTTEWGLLRAAGRIVGVHSQSAARPLRTAFTGRDAGFASANGYDEWLFIYTPDSAAPPSAASGSPVHVGGH